MYRSMTEKTENSQAGKGAKQAVLTKEARLKAALKANMSRRKAQAKQRAGLKNHGEDLPDRESGAEKE